MRAIWTQFAQLIFNVEVNVEDPLPESPSRVAGSPSAPARVTYESGGSEGLSRSPLRPLAWIRSLPQLRPRPRPGRRTRPCSTASSAAPPSARRSARPSADSSP